MEPGENSTARGAVVITGASTGIGKACALHLQKLGFRVFAGVRREKDGEALQQEGSHLLTPLLLDVTSDHSVISGAERVAAEIEGAGLAGLVNNAGIVIPGPLEFTSKSDLQKQLDVNVIGQMAVTQGFVPLLRKSKGRIVNMGSVSGRVASPFLGPYCASKFALEALTDSLRIELRPWGICVSIVEPGMVATPLMQKIMVTADELEEKLPGEGRELYGSALKKMRRFADRLAKSAISVDRVVAAVTHALMAKRPRTRYLVGASAKFEVLLLKFMPDRLRDEMVLLQTGLRSRRS